MSDARIEAASEVLYRCTDMTRAWCDRTADAVLVAADVAEESSAAATRSALRQLLDALEEARFTQDHAAFTAEARIKYAQAKEAAERALVPDTATL